MEHIEEASFVGCDYVIGQVVPSMLKECNAFILKVKDPRRTTCGRDSVYYIAIIDAGVRQPEKVTNQ
jgi:hypothetical protein